MKNTSKIEIILCSMFSGKTTELIRKLSRYQAIDMNILVINHTSDTRTTEYIQTTIYQFVENNKLNKLILIFL
jgi:thymidine kinase